MFKIYELKDYNQLFTVPEYHIHQVDIYNLILSYIMSIRFGSPGNIEMVTYGEVSKKLFVFKIYSKRNLK